MYCPQFIYNKNTLNSPLGNVQQNCITKKTPTNEGGSVRCISFSHRSLELHGMHQRASIEWGKVMGKVQKKRCDSDSSTHQKVGGSITDSSGLCAELSLSKILSLNVGWNVRMHVRIDKGAVWSGEWDYLPFNQEALIHLESPYIGTHPSIHFRLSFSGLRLS